MSAKNIASKKGFKWKNNEVMKIKNVKMKIS